MCCAHSTASKVLVGSTGHDARKGEPCKNHRTGMEKPREDSIVCRLYTLPGVGAALAAQSLAQALTPGVSSPTSPTSPTCSPGQRTLDTGQWPGPQVQKWLWQAPDPRQRTLDTGQWPGPRVQKWLRMQQVFTSPCCPNRKQVLTQCCPKTSQNPTIA